MPHKNYTVGPKPGDKKGWKVESNGRIVSRHNTKRNAIKRAKQLADRNDVITVQKSNGQFHKRLRG